MNVGPTDQYPSEDPKTPIRPGGSQEAPKNRGRFVASYRRLRRTIAVSAFFSGLLFVVFLVLAFLSECLQALHLLLAAFFLGLGGYQTYALMATDPITGEDKDPGPNEPATGGG